MDTHRNVIELPLRSPHFEYVECGSKTVDVRIRFNKYRCLQAGDVVKFVKSRQKFILKKLTSIKPYDNFGHTQSLLLSFHAFGAHTDIIDVHLAHT